MKIENIFLRWIAGYFIIAQIWNKTFAAVFEEDCGRMGIFKKKHKDSSLQNHIIQIIEVSNVAMCTIACVDHVQCQSYNFQETENAVKSCELNSSNKSSSSSDLKTRMGYSYYDKDPCLNGVGISAYKCSGYECLIPTSCKTAKELGLSQGDGEYDLYVLYPDCLKTARVYCADMDTDNPLEYVTLSAGRNTNYGFDNRQGGTYPSSHSKTAFDKIRLKVPSMNVVISDSRFSAQIVGTYFINYGKAADCMWSSTCAGYQNNRYGKAEADLTGTTFKFPSVIPYKLRSYPSCAKVLVAPTMSADLKKWSVRCGGHCGGCWPEVLILDVDGC